MGVIKSFTNEYVPFSSMYPLDVEIDGIIYGSSIAAFEAQKCLEQAMVFSKLDPSEAYSLGHTVCLPNNWEDIKISVRYNIELAKFSQNPELKQMLLDTNDDYIVAGNIWKDKFWGQYYGDGSNYLGKILMKIRKDFRLENN